MTRLMASQLASSVSFAPTGLSFRPTPFSVSFPQHKLQRRQQPPPQRGRLVITCVRVAGVEIPNNKRIEWSLQSIYGIGRSLSRQILLDLEYENKYTFELTEEEITRLRKEVTKYKIEGELRRFNKNAIEFLKQIRCYRGIRHQKGLPCRGQRTRNNCRTLKGKRIPVAGKKKSSKKT